MKTGNSLKKVNEENIVPFRPISLFEEMERMFDSFMPSNWQRPTQIERTFLNETMPKVDVISKDDVLLVKASLPGVKKEDLDVTTTERSITIKGKTHSEQEQEEGEYFRREIHSGHFVRTIPLPTLIDESAVIASYKDGMLEVTLPRKTVNKPNSVEIS